MAYNGLREVYNGWCIDANVFPDQGISQQQAMRHVTMQVITNQACAQVYGNSAIVASVICTATTGGRGTCQGDSGGPLDVGSGGSRTLVR